MEVGEEALAMGFQRNGSEFTDGNPIDVNSNGSPALNDSGYHEENSVIGLGMLM